MLSTSRENELTRAGSIENFVKSEKFPETGETTQITLNKTFHFWHVYVRGLKPNIHYAYRMGGKFDPSSGYRFDGEKTLIDPYSKGNNKTLWDRGKACVPGDNLATSMRSAVIDSSGYDWDNDNYIVMRAVDKAPISMASMLSEMPRKRELKETVIYELHIGGFTRSSTSRVTKPGTFTGATERIPYLK